MKKIIYALMMMVGVVGCVLVPNDVTTSGQVDGYDYVDLGLSVKWATYNVGATKPTEYGDYFAWGENQPKEIYNFGTYKWCKGENNSFSTLYKYVRTNTVGSIDNKTELESQDDAATVNWGEGWRTPTKEEQQELLDGCIWKWVKDFGGSGINGNIGISKVNGNSIFLPANGIRLREKNNTHGIGRYGNYWSSSLSQEESMAYIIHYLDEQIVWDSQNSRDIGIGVRAVVK